MLEEREEICSGKCGKGRKVGRRGKEGTGEGFIQRGDGDEHEGTAGPDVEMAGGDGEGGCSGRDMKLTP